MNRIYRSQRDKKIMGLCGGLAEAFHVDATLLRLIFVAAAIFTGGSVVLLYIVAGLVIPKEPTFGPSFGYGGGYGPQYGGAGGYGAQAGAAEPQADNGGLDEMMKDIEKKAMEKELAELKAKLAKYEKGEHE